ncbi:hypothetical protein [Actinomycetospora soli]|uniref:hypothetical protein n=1 Tax=Actinomycetospora soli TaxID=2893887 RepID=UPI001E42C08A|nr:hypothetical protein [Actinomycetospora soli]MCD2191368.1 hypothetical protein [Actinomycetospora soli]
MRLDDPLHTKQVAVLRWIAEGCPEGVMEGHSYKQTARALADRRLVTVSRGHAGWSAKVTDTGRYYLEHGEFPARPPAKTPASRRLSAARAGDASGKASAQVQGPCETVKKTPAADRQPRRLSPTEQLVADVVAAGGVLEAADSYPASSRQAMLVAAVNRFAKAPGGQYLVVRRRRDPDDPYRSIRELVLVDGPVGTDAELIPVPVPERVARYHPAVAALRARDALSVSAGVRSRAWHVLQALAAEAERRGHSVAASPEPGPVQNHRSPPERWHLEITVGAETVRLRIEEERDRVAHEPTAAELEQQRRSSWTRIPTYDWIASGRLGMRLQGEATSSARRLNWADRTKWRLEDKLPEVLREVAVRADGLRRAREARAEAQARHDREVAAEQERARDRAAEHHRGEVLDKQLERWRETRELREFARELAERITAAEQTLASQQEILRRSTGGDVAGEDDLEEEDGVEADDTVDGGKQAGQLAEARAWLAWVQARAAARDPFDPLPGMPAQRRLREWELTKFMRPVPPPRPGDY